MVAALAPAFALLLERGAQRTGHAYAVHRVRAAAAVGTLPPNAAASASKVWSASCTGVDERVEREKIMESCPSPN